MRVIFPNFKKKKKRMKDSLQIMSPTLKSRPANQEARSLDGSQPRSPPTTWCTWAATILPPTATKIDTTSKIINSFTLAISDIFGASLQPKWYKIRKKKNENIRILLRFTLRKITIFIYRFPPSNLSRAKKIKNKNLYRKPKVRKSTVEIKII